MALRVIVDGQVTHEVNENGRNGIRRSKTVVFGNGEIDVKFESQADYDAFPKRGENVVAEFVGSYVQTEFGAIVKKLRFARVLSGAASAAPEAAGSARRMTG